MDAGWSAIDLSLVSVISRMVRLVAGEMKSLRDVSKLERPNGGMYHQTFWSLTFDVRPGWTTNFRTSLVF